jgi:hypothetical protein
LELESSPCRLLLTDLVPSRLLSGKGMDQRYESELRIGTRISRALSPPETDHRRLVSNPSTTGDGAEKAEYPRKAW